MCHLLWEILPHWRISLSLELIFLQGNFWHASAQTPWLCVAMFQREVAISWLPSPEEKKFGRVPRGNLWWIFFGSNPGTQDANRHHRRWHYSFVNLRLWRFASWVGGRSIRSKKFLDSRSFGFRRRKHQVLALSTMGYIFFGYWTLGNYLYKSFYVVNLVIVGIFNLEKQMRYIVTCWTCFCFITFLLLQGVDLDMYRCIFTYIHTIYVLSIIIYVDINVSTV